MYAADGGTSDGEWGDQKEDEDEHEAVGDQNDDDEDVLQTFMPLTVMMTKEDTGRDIALAHRSLSEHVSIMIM